MYIIEGVQQAWIHEFKFTFFSMVDNPFSSLFLQYLFTFTSTITESPLGYSTWKVALLAPIKICYNSNSYSTHCS